ncbi:MAG: phosphoenolpyruvate carboxykinase (ATP) [Candidatus Micrarchaeota archaeon]
MSFKKELERLIENAEIIFNPSEDELREMAKGEGKETRFGSVCYKTKLKGRSAKHTQVIEGKATEEQVRTIQKVVEYVANKKLIQLDRQMCLTKPFLCRAYVSAEYAHIAQMWGMMLFKEVKIDHPDFITVQIPEWPETKIICEPKDKITFILGSDYTGELKKANLRLAMFAAKQRGGLGLHAGSKLIRVIADNGELQEKGVLLFGLSATGKTTLTCHHHWLDALKREGVAIRQDDVVLLDKDSSAIGTEKNFYIKTDGLEAENQGVLYEAAIGKSALFENVAVLPDGTIDFFDTTDTANGRAVVPRNEMRHTDLDIDLPKTDIVLFITRRNTIVPPVARLSAEQGAAFFMLGESIGSSASDVDPGKTRRVVGTNPFIIGPLHEEGNRFYEILKRNPHIKCFLLNTGKIGEGGLKETEKITVRDSASIIREIARESIKWKKDPNWGYEVMESCPGIDISRLEPTDHYSSEDYQKLTQELKDERQEWLHRFKGLKKEIRDCI